MDEKNEAESGVCVRMGIVRGLHDSHETLFYLPDRTILTIILANVIEPRGLIGARCRPAVNSTNFVSTSMNCN